MVSDPIPVIQIGKDSVVGYEESKAGGRGKILVHARHVTTNHIALPITI